MTIADVLKRNDFYELAKLTLDNNKEGEIENTNE